MTVLNVKDIYQDLHQIPEVGFQEFKTSAYLADALEKIGYKVTRNVGGTGVIWTHCLSSLTASTKIFMPAATIPTAPWY